MEQPSKPKPTTKSAHPYQKYSDEDREVILNDLREHLRVTKAFRLFREKPSPSPGVPGSGPPSSSLQVTSALTPLAPMAPLSPSAGNSLRTGQAAPPRGHSPMNPWGANRGGSGMLPLYRCTEWMSAIGDFALLAITEDSVAAYCSTLTA